MKDVADEEVGVLAHEDTTLRVGELITSASVERD
jgi:hypothetical protein